MGQSGETSDRVQMLVAHAIFTLISRRIHEGAVGVGPRGAASLNYFGQSRGQCNFFAVPCIAETFAAIRPRGTADGEDKKLKLFAEPLMYKQTWDEACLRFRVPLEYMQELFPELHYTEADDVSEEDAAPEAVRPFLLEICNLPPLFNLLSNLSTWINSVCFVSQRLFWGSRERDVKFRIRSNQRLLRTTRKSRFLLQLFQSEAYMDFGRLGEGPIPLPSKLVKTSGAADLYAAVVAVVPDVFSSGAGAPQT